MSATYARAPLPHGLLGRLGPRPEAEAADPGRVAADLALLAETGYLKLALPAEFGGGGLDLRQVACAQRQLASRAPVAALAVTAHHAWVGAAADALASGDASAAWVLSEAAQGRLFTDSSGLARQAIVRTFARQADLGPGPARVRPAGPPGDTFVAGMYGWALPLAGMTCYAIARHAFGLAVEHARLRDGAGFPGADRAGTDRAGAGRPGTGGTGPDRAGSGRGESGYPLGQWAAVEAALRLDGIRDQLDEVIHGWQQRVAAGGALTSLDPGGQWLIRLFTVRHAAADGARRVLELTAQITSETARQPGPVPGWA